LFFNHYILKEREDSTDAHLIAGRAAHCLLLEPQEFDNLFVMVPGKIPTDSNKVIIDHIFANNYLPMRNDSLSLEDFPQEILNQLLVNNLYQSLKTDPQRLEKIITDNNKEYFNFLKIKDKKTVIDQSTKIHAEETVEVIKNNSQIKALLALGHDNTNGVTVHNEIALSSDFEPYKFGFKGILDNVVVDENIKTVFINDLKLTSKLIQDFVNSVEKFRYDIQCTIYRGLAYDKFISKRDDAHEWNMVFTFVVVDKYNQVYPYQVSNETANMWQEEFYNTVNQINYHYESRDYTLPYDLALGNVKL
jgi:hypothetical protein